jgi:AhpD family alkylhydroperoxidase
MKRIILSLAAVLMLSGFQAKAQEMMKLSERQKSLVAIAAMEAKGNINGLKTALDRGLDNGLTVSEAKEALSQLYAYTGFPRSLNGLGALQQVLAERRVAGKTTDEGREANPVAPDYDALKQGTEVQTRLSGAPFNYTFAPQTDYYLKAHLFGDIFSRDNLSFADREIVTVSAISALPGCEPQLAAHVRGAVNMGVNPDQLREIPGVLTERVGDEEGNRAARAVADFFGKKADVVATIDFSVWPKGEPNTAYAQYFIGNSYLYPLSAEQGGPVNVTFEPRCRNNWHIHHSQVQVLVCVAGRGWYQEWGKEPIELKPGTVVAIPAEAKHWHGAARDSWMQHLTYHTHVEANASNEWLEPVGDDIYDKLP